ncbi:uncharacterized protein LOC114525374 [Dendronephthya gigantea]|uniref:uncharacterized protein LOC114525374 n=1 Tax=Dendronephthya gigantea TaxID=151771 RepID=UPI00106BA02D|nr:uncharacterized protein LOC114525374 [Dendronephthya gigantea]
MALDSSLGDAFLFICIALCLTAVRSSDDWISVRKVTPDPDFVRVGQSLKIRLDIDGLDLYRGNTTGYWAFSPDFTERSYVRELQMVRQLGSSSEVYFSYDTARVSRERYIDLVVKNMTLADSGVYRCKFRRPPRPWSIRVEFRVIVEEEEMNLYDAVPQIVHVTRGQNLKLRPSLPEVFVSSSGENYEKFWDFSSVLRSRKEENADVRIISWTESSIKDVDNKISLEENGTTLVLRNTTLNESGVYHFRMMKPKSTTTAIHVDFNVDVEEKPVASITCPSIVRLLEEQSFFCLCKDISQSEVTAQAMWLRNGQTLKNSRPFHEEELYLENVTRNDEGFYICRVRTETAIVEISLEVLILPVKEEMKVEKPTVKRRPTWLYLAGSLGVGVLLGIVLVLVIKHVRGKCRKSKGVYEDVRFNSSGLELDVTAQYQDMNRNMSLHEVADSASPYEVADLPETYTTYVNVNQASSPGQEIVPELCLQEDETSLVPGYTDLDNRFRVDSHPYQDLQQYCLPENVEV